MITETEKRFWTEFIELYKSKPELWKINHEDYKQRDCRKAAYDALIGKCKEFEPLADKNFVAKKINSFRTVYRRELKRCSQSSKYKPSLWYFNHLDFLRELEEADVEETEELDFMFKKREFKKQKERQTKSKKLSNHKCYTEDFVHLATQRLISSQDSCHQVTNVWANKLCKMDRNQRLFAEKVISEVVFNGELGLLKYNTSLCNLNMSEYINYSSPSVNKNGTSVIRSGSSKESQFSMYINKIGCETNDTELSDQESI